MGASSLVRTPLLSYALLAVIFWWALVVAVIGLAVAASGSAPIAVAGDGGQTSPFRWT